MAVATDGQVYSNGYTLYHPKNDGNGAASCWRLTDTPKGRAFFLEVARQTGKGDNNSNDSFGWRRKDKDSGEWTGEANVAKLGLPDIGEMILVLDGVKKKAGPEGKGLFHKNQKGSSTINFEVWEKDGVQQGFTVRVATKDGDSAVSSISHALSLSEAVVLRILLQNSVLQLANW